MKSHPFTDLLLAWFETHYRPMPWKGEKDPYLIWLSEIILQQTRVAQGLPYFEKFKASFPSVQDLAQASEDKVLKHWEGLGYYSRARNLHFTAKYIANELAGVFPNTYDEILKLKGVGPYTAAAIASFAYDIPKAVVDGNVYRVLARVFDIETPIDSTLGKKEFAQLAESLLSQERPADFNQAIMDFGASICVPKNPKCKSCPLSEICEAYAKNKVALLPVKSKKIKKRNRFFHYLLINEGNSIFIKKRTEKDIWKGLYDFPLIEKEQLLDPKLLVQEPLFKKIFPDANYKIQKASKIFKQQLTHQSIQAIFIEIETSITKSPTWSNWQKVVRQDIRKYAFPKLVERYLQDKNLYLF